jgi:hypothetical protein
LEGKLDKQGEMTPREKLEKALAVFSQFPGEADEIGQGHTLLHLLRLGASRVQEPTVKKETE